MRPGSWIRPESEHPARRARRLASPRGGWSSLRWANATALDNRGALQPHQLGDAALRQGEELLELGAGEAALFASGLDLDDVADAGQHEVGVGLGAGIF